MPTNPNILMDNARCVDNCIPAGMQMAVLIGLIDALASVGGGSSIGFQSGVPVVPPSNTSQVSLNINLLTGLLYYWNPSTLTWTLVTTGAGAQQVYTSAGNPNGVVLVSTVLPCICLDTIGQITWQKTDSALTNTGWY